jgi:hypothetical protein
MPLPHAPFTAIELSHSCRSARKGTRNAPGCYPRQSKGGQTLPGESLTMLWAVVLVSFVMWIVLFVFFHAAGGLVDAVLVVALAAAIYDLLTDRRRAI